MRELKSLIGLYRTSHNTTICKWNGSRVSGRKNTPQISAFNDHTTQNQHLSFLFPSSFLSRLISLAIVKCTSIYIYIYIYIYIRASEYVHTLQIVKLTKQIWAPCVALWIESKARKPLLTHCSWVSNTLTVCPVDGLWGFSSGDLRSVENLFITITLTQKKCKYEHAMNWILSPVGIK